MLHTDAMLLVGVDPALWEESVRVWEHTRVGLVEYGRHADDGLGLSEVDYDVHRGGIKEGDAPLLLVGVCLGWGMLTPAGISHSL